MKIVGVIGAGTMGSGIAQATALGGYNVLLYDIALDFVERGWETLCKQIDDGQRRGKISQEKAERAKSAVTRTTVLDDVAKADLIIEVAPEKLELKRDIFAKLDALAPPHTIFASNTSSLSISAMASATQRTDRFVGLHFFNPAHIMPLIEVIVCEHTSWDTLSQTFAYAKQIDKTPVQCKDSPAFIVNRVARPFYGEAFRLLGEGNADIATIDALMESVGFKMGPFKLIDLIGCDINFAVTQSVYNAYFQDPKYRPHPIQQRMVESGRLGKKVGKGFYDYK
jgi:3-hydroxybutyryl-CoA dehydrogenase